MVAWKCWFDLRPRFFWTIGLSLFFAVEFVASYLINTDTDFLSFLFLFEEDFQQAVPRLVQDYSFYIDMVWFETHNRFFAFIAIAIALGGILSQRNGSSLHMTLSLPAKRSKWLLVHAGMSALLVFVLVFTSTICVLIGSLIIDQHYPLDTALLRAIVLWLFCLPWISLSLLANSLLHNTFKSVIIVIIVFAVIHSFKLPELYLYPPFRLSGPYDWQQNFPWEAFLILILTTIATIFLAIKKFEGNDY